MQFHDQQQLSERPILDLWHDDPAYAMSWISHDMDDSYEQERGNQQQPLPHPVVSQDQTSWLACDGFSLSPIPHDWLRLIPTPAPEVSEKNHVGPFSSTLDSYHSGSLPDTHPIDDSMTTKVDITSFTGHLADANFETVMRHWPNRRPDGRPSLSSFWQDIHHHTAENIFSLTSVASGIEGNGNNTRITSKWGFDRECALRLQRDCGLDLQASVSPGRNNHMYTEMPVAERETGSAQSSDGSTITFPLADILDVSLDIYFRRYHPLQPFIHLPTFNARTTSSNLLMALCLIGLSIINTEGATRFVRSCLSVGFVH
jgi:hypothetical protein